MDITFTRGEAGAYTATVIRDDGVKLLVRGGDRTFPFPHDFAHYVVEQGLGLQKGFWGRVAAGAVYPGMQMLAGKRPVRATEQSKIIIREAEQQGVEAEVWVGLLLKVMHEGLESNWAQVQALMKAEWRPSKPERPLPNAEEVRRVCIALREAECQWQALAVGQTMTVQWSFSPRKKR